MASENRAPETLLEAVQYFADADRAVAFVAAIRWPDGVTCPRCGKQEATYLKTRRLWKCRECAKQFSAKVGSIFEDSPIGFDKWLPAMWLLANCKNGISSYELARDLKVTQKTAWFMLHRLRAAMQSKTFNLMRGNIELDETYIGAKARNMHPAKRAMFTRTKGHPWAGKIAVMGLLERHGKDGHSRMRTIPIPDTKQARLHGHVYEHVEPGSNVYTDALQSYKGMEDYTHHIIDHAETYVDGEIHTNGCENFWSLLKRALRGTYVSVEPFHLYRYLDEQCFRFNERHTTDAIRFVQVLSSVFGRRLTYAALTGRVQPERC